MKGAWVLTIECRSCITDGESTFMAWFSMGMTRGATDAIWLKSNSRDLAIA